MSAFILSDCFNSNSKSHLSFNDSGTRLSCGCIIKLINKHYGNPQVLSIRIIASYFTVLLLSLSVSVLFCMTLCGSSLIRFLHEVIIIFIIIIYFRREGTPYILSIVKRKKIGIMCITP